jgi:hypothetical protein
VAEASKPGAVQGRRDGRARRREMGAELTLLVLYSAVKFALLR